MMDGTYKDVFRPFLVPGVCNSTDMQVWQQALTSIAIQEAGAPAFNQVEAFILPSSKMVPWFRFLKDNKAFAVFTNYNEHDSNLVRTALGTKKVFFSMLMDRYFPDTVFGLACKQFTLHSQTFLKIAGDTGADAALIHMLNSILAMHLNWFQVNPKLWTARLSSGYGLSNFSKGFGLPDFCGNWEAFMEYPVRTLMPYLSGIPEGLEGRLYFLSKLYEIHSYPTLIQPDQGNAQVAKGKVPLDA